MTIYDARFQLIEHTFDVMTSDNLSTKVNIAFIGVLIATLLLVTYVPIIPMLLVNWFYS